MNNCGFGIFATGGKERPEDARHTGEVGDKSGWNADYVAIVVTEVKFKRLLYAP